MTQDRAPTGGRDVFGEPGKPGEVTVERDGPAVRAVLVRHGTVSGEARGAILAV
ncbi:hypothetical protein [Streptomyces sp. NPDC056785]|uniref:hypothetical protein n=1 Tax=Streptomyces sp. NPDC056785 TaxID=3345944 RepID=UPI0036ABD699